ncbi:class I SAM-dependent methyltransferase [Lonepinella koalarum]|uniref:tRNA (Cmo5U34)-methyltransferase n=1 Tax=Lonepinella koalarum TaxID=53417 RepID=A0A4R1L4M8_9PAST|nr:class I SAM-dependent methyltransferase [Lonepinella koalarum]MDH2926028.1 hypothetical protein [Lonepinella koalarum]TCK71179.1 tRNA (cmo5U34)-methyltransferase [Lonepinella koalarum]TFJ90907.1 class I SAM-dependent methyltransferase [Lonepinella koalarum]
MSNLPLDTHIEIFSNERASNYDNFVDNWIPGYHYFLDFLPKILDQNSPKSILVAGCGTGNEIVKLADYRDDWQITGFDPSPEMISQAQHKLSDYPNIVLKNCTINDLQKEQCFQAATLLLVLHFIPDDGQKLSLLKDIADRLESGSSFILLDITGDGEQLDKSLKILKDLLANSIGEDEKLARIERIKRDFHLVPENRFVELCTQAGFYSPIRFFQSTVYVGWHCIRR